MFVDQAVIRVRSGAGGAGAVSFRREKYVPKGGPDGGNGGDGGSVILRADSQLHTLLDHRYRSNYTAEDGKGGSSSRKTGRTGEDTIIQVPTGTLIVNADTGEHLADLVEDGDVYIAAHGGRGGRGNAEFATPTLQTPRISEPGQPGEQKHLLLELKLIADIGLVGFPNAGKSTLISVISAAHPKIADYPFTTLEPNLGIVRYRDYSGFSVVDIPGLIEGAHKGKGLGMKFLRHIERTKALAILLDCLGEQYAHDLLVLRTELESYSKELSIKPFLVVVTKLDCATPDIERGIDAFETGLPQPLLRISSVTGKGITELLDAMWNLLRKTEKESGDAPGQPSDTAMQ